jgi:hypothetical protein
MTVALARLALALIDAQNSFDALEPPIGVTEIRRWIKAEL